MDAHGRTQGSMMTVVGLLVLLAAGVLRVAWEIPALHARIDLPSTSMLYAAMGAGGILMLVGSLRNMSSTR